MSNTNHPIAFKLGSGGEIYTTGVTSIGVPGQPGAFTKIVTSEETPDLYYYCTIHGEGMGNSINSVTSVVNELNAEENQSHTITVKASSTDGSSTIKQYTINVSDLNEFDLSSVNDINNLTNTISENEVKNKNVGITVNATDEDQTDTVSYY